MKKYTVQTALILVFCLLCVHTIAKTESEENKQDDKTLISKTVQAIRAKVQSQWINPHERSSSGLSCVAVVELLPDGRVKKVQIRQSSGHSDFDKSVLSAIRRASPFPIPEKEFERFKLFSFSFRTMGQAVPSTQTTPVEPVPSHMVVRKDIQKNLFLDDDQQALSSSELLTQIVDKLQRNPHLEVIVKGDMNLPYGEMIQLLQLLQQTGIEKIRIDQIDLKIIDDHFVKRKK